MKKLIIIALVAIAFASCEKDEQSAFKVKATDKISIKAAASVAKSPMQKVSSVYTHLSALEIVKKTTEISLIMHGGTYEGIKGGRSFASEQRDTISATPKLLMWATDVISLDGALGVGNGGFIDATDVVFVHYNLSTPTLRDTIAYIPNSVLRAAEIGIKAAYEAKNIENCYTLFNEAYTFIPVTGAEWRTLKAAGQN